MTVSTQPYRGARDFYPEDLRLRKWLFGQVRTVAERFGYEEYDAPVLEPTELYLMKGNQEIIDQQTYTFTDRGNRSVTIRTEMTPTVSRMVAGRRQELNYPLRWYSIPNLWRYERMQRGRLREFWQPNFDLFGVAGVEADAEIIQLADSLMRQLGAKPEAYRIRISSRQLVNAALEKYLGLEEVSLQTIVRLIDKKDKMEVGEFVACIEAAISPVQRELKIVDKLLDLIKISKLSELPPELLNVPAVTRLIELFDLLAKMNVTSAEFDLSLMRGFDYYTDMVFEIFDTDPQNSRSLFGGGRYDGLVGLFGVDPVPTVGFAVSDVSLQNFLETHELVPKVAVESDLYVVLIGDTFVGAQNAIAKLREEGVNVAVDYSGRKIGKQIETAVKKGIPYLMVVGEDELTSEQYKFKDLRTGREETHSLDRIVSMVKDRRRK